VSLSLIPTPVFRSLGLILGFGVAVALLLAMTLVPALFAVMPEPKPLRRGITSFVQTGLDTILAGMQELATRRPRLVIPVFVALLAASLTGITGITIETDFARRLAPDNRIRRDQAWFETYFGGTTMLDLYLSVPEKDGLLDPSLIASAARYQAALQELPEVDDAFSLINLLERIHIEMHEDDHGVAPLPTTRPALAQYLLMFEMAGGEDLQRLIDFDRRTMRIAVRLKEQGVRSCYRVGKQAVLMGQQNLGHRVTLEASGLSYLLGDWLDAIIQGQVSGLFLSVFTIATMMVLALRSLGMGLWSMIPNLFPLLVLGGYVGIFWDQADSDVIMVAIIAIGIGVDDTIHFLVRYRIEAARSQDTLTAVRRSFAFAGRAIVMTTFILVAGFIPFAVSDYFTTHMLGTQLPMCLLVALLTDLLLVPALVRVGAMRVRPA
jgi:predicted RND superfamily exporter protein